MRATFGQISLDFLRTVRNVQFLIFTLGMPVGFYLLYGAMYGSERVFAHTSWGAYFLVSMATYGAIGTALNVTGAETAQERARGWQTQLAVTPLSGTQYVVAKIVTALIAGFGVMVLLTLVAAGRGVAIFSLAVVPAVLAVWLGSISFAALGLWIGQVLNGTTASYGVVVAYLVLGFLGGLWTPLSVLPPVFSHIATYLPSYAAASLGWAVLAHHHEPLHSIAVLVGYIIVFGGAGGLLYARREFRRE